MGSAARTDKNFRSIFWETVPSKAPPYLIVSEGNFGTKSVTRPTFNEICTFKQHWTKDWTIEIEKLKSWKRYPCLARVIDGLYSNEAFQKFSKTVADEEPRLSFRLGYSGFSQIERQPLGAKYGKWSANLEGR